MGEIIAGCPNIANIIKGSKDKENTLKQLSENMKVSLSNICYIGDSDKDAAIRKICNLGIVPQDATNKSKESASVILKIKDDDDVVYEIIDQLVKNKCLNRI